MANKVPGAQSEFKNDVDLFYRRLLATAAQGIDIEQWGEVEGLPIYCLKAHSDGEIKKHILIVAGFHGDEEAGPWAVVRFLESNFKPLLVGIELTFLPLVNPTGFKVATRENNLGQNPNRGFIKNEMNLSKEGQILMARLNELKVAAEDGVMSLHEDGDVDEGGFVYSWTDNNLAVAMALRNVVRDTFGLATRETILKLHKANTAEDIVEEGLIVNEDDGDFGDNLHINEGISPAIVTETPAKAISLEKRIQVNVQLIQEFCKMMT